MDERERVFTRRRFWYRFWTIVMSVGILLFVCGLILIPFYKTWAAAGIAYGVIVIILSSSFFFITRSRYNKSRLSYRAFLHAQSAKK